MLVVNNRQLSSTSLPGVNSTNHPVCPGHHRHHHRRGHRGMMCPTYIVEVSQGLVDPLPSGIPHHLVQICNICGSGRNRTAYDIHLNCGWFASAELINPCQFRRLSFNDCLVNDGRRLEPGSCVSQPSMTLVSSIEREKE
ncbi:hypothetical protein MKW94_002947 [Papaver nudicaule]|uniref:Uncharacterized protein n=1 Tax=Papaver nudicaule TaxID=74823 RepID=A0AA41V2V7_PAPNU|nr:hypothetical protein [Papaver nudicaule]